MSVDSKLDNENVVHDSATEQTNTPIQKMDTARISSIPHIWKVSALVVVALVVLGVAGVVWSTHFSTTVSAPTSSSSQATTTAQTKTNKKTTEKWTPISLVSPDSSIYKLKQGKVYCTSNFTTVLLPQADPATFKVAGNYAKDSAHVYTKCDVLAKADPATFVTNSSIKQVKNVRLKTYTNYAYGFSIKLPTDNNVYTCEQGKDGKFKVVLANEKSYDVFIFEDPLNAKILGLKSLCGQGELPKYNSLFINARESQPREYSGFVKNWEKSYNGKYAVVKEIKFAQHNALLKTRVERISNNNNLYRVVLIDGEKYFDSINLNNKSAYLEKIMSTFEIVPAKDNFSDWNTLRNKTLGIEIKYPYSYRENVSVPSIGKSYLTIYPVPQPVEFGTQLSLLMEPVPDNVSVDKYVDTYIENNKSVTERKDVTINGVRWIKIKYTDTSDVLPKMSYINYFTIKNNDVYTVHYTNNKDIDTENFNKIVNTIKFISATKTY